MKGSLIIIAFFALGVACGLGRVFSIDLAQTDISFYTLCALMFCVGVGIGSDPQTLRNFRSLSPRLMLLPAGTIVGTLAGAAVVSLLLTHRSTGDCLAVGAGFGYYSLSSIFITEYKGAELGTVALLANIIREILTLLLAPLLARRFGPLAPIIGAAVCHRIYLSWFFSRLQRAVSRHLVLRAVESQHPDNQPFMLSAGKSAPKALEARSERLGCLCPQAFPVLQRQRREPICRTARLSLKKIKTISCLYQKK